MAKQWRSTDIPNGDIVCCRALLCTDQSAWRLCTDGKDFSLSCETFLVGRGVFPMCSTVQKWRLRTSQLSSCGSINGRRRKISSMPRRPTATSTTSQRTLSRLLYVSLGRRDVANIVIELRQARLPYYVVAPYEADTQLAWLRKSVTSRKAS